MGASCCTSTSQASDGKAARNTGEGATAPMLSSDAQASVDMAADSLLDQFGDDSDLAKDEATLRQQWDRLVFTRAPHLNYVSVCPMVQRNPELDLLARAYTEERRGSTFDRPPGLPEAGDTLLHVAVRKKEIKMLHFALTIGMDPNLQNERTEETPLDIALKQLRDPPADLKSLKIVAMLLDFGATMTNPNLNRILDGGFKKLNSMAEHNAVRRNDSLGGGISAQRLQDMRTTTLTDAVCHAKETPLPEAAYGALVDHLDDDPHSPTYQEWRPVYLYVDRAVVCWSKRDHNGQVGFRFSVYNDEFWNTNGGGFVHLLTLAKPSLEKAVDRTLREAAYDFAMELHGRKGKLVFRAGSQQMLKALLDAVRTRRKYMAEITR